MRPLRPVRLLLAAAAIAACGGADDAAEVPADAALDTASAAVDTTVSADTASATLLADEFPSGSPMPSAERTGGIPPYPNAIVYTRTRRGGEEFRTFEAFTDDPVEDVIAFYDRQLPSWRRVEAEDTDLWVLDPDRAAVSVSAWDWENAHPDLPRFLREEARTAIGVAFRVSEATAEDTTPND